MPSIFLSCQPFLLSKGSPCASKIKNLFGGNIQIIHVEPGSHLLKQLCLLSPNARGNMPAYLACQQVLATEGVTMC